MIALQSSPTDIYVPAGTPTAELQAIIDTAPYQSTIHLAPGDHVVTETLVVNRSDISIQGAGGTETRLIQSAALEGQPVLQVGPQWVAATVEELPPLEHTALTGGRMIRFDEAHGLKPGDVVYITQENTPELFAEIGDTQWQKDAPLRTFMATVERVGGNSVALSERLPFDFDPAITKVEKMDPLTGVKLGGFEVTTTYGASNPGRFSNTIGEEYRANLIDISNTLGLEVNDVTVTEPGSNGIDIATSLYAQFTDVTVTGAHNKGAGGNGYALQIRDVYHSEFTGIEVFDARHGVLFSSYQTAVGNYVVVTDTNRDVNFHGGLDRDNTVIVDNSIRTKTEQSYLGSSSYFNEGESWGAPTDPDLNTVVFRHVNGTVRSDTLVAHDDGAWIAGFEGADVIHGGAGDDFIFGETGHDVIHASRGNDTIDAGSGSDRLVLTGTRDSYAFSEIDDGFVISNAEGVTRVVDVETFQFADITISQSALESWV